jgi:hydrogenase expression/formation protein HypD
MSDILTFFAQPEKGAEVLAGIKQKAKRRADSKGIPLKIMEVCGTHTVVLGQSGIRQFLRPELELLSGPGCPVCVTHQRDIDRMIALARIPNAILTTFGDMLRVPGSESSLEIEKARGCDIRIIYNPLEALGLARQNPEKEVIFLGIGFETTIPLVGKTILLAKEEGLKNFSVFSTHKLLPPALRALFRDGDFELDGLLLPGHVAVTLGRKAFDFVAQELGLKAVIAGFEPLDLLFALNELLDSKGKPEVKNAYPRAVREEGNIKAQNTINQVFVESDALWRGMGEIAQSGLELKEEFAAYNSSLRFEVKPIATIENSGCRCGEVIQGKVKPMACPFFALKCTPLNPLGPCMVSSEGACASYYKYEREE